MRLKKHKRAKKLLQNYIQHFAFREPFRIVVDGTFCQAALETRTNLKEDIPSYLGVPATLVTTKCVVDELVALGEDFRGAKLVAKRCEIKKCGHYDVSVSADQCIAKFIGPKNRHNYMVATQDAELKKTLRKVPGVPIINLDHSQLVLETPSRETVQYIADLNKAKVYSGLSNGPIQQAERAAAKLAADAKAEKARKNKAGPLSTTADPSGTGGSTVKYNRKRKAKGANPLSMKKKKKNKPGQGGIV